MLSHEARQRALEAGHILASPVFHDAFAALDARYVAMWRGAQSAEERDRAWIMQRQLSALKKEIFDVLQCAAVKEQGKDKQLNAVLNAAREKERIHG